RSGSFLVQSGFEFVDSLEVGGFSTEQIDNFNGGAEGPERIQLEDLQRFDTRNAGIGVFLEERLKDRAGLRLVHAEDVALLHPRGAFLSGKWRAIKGDVANEVKRIEILSDLFGEFVEEDALLGQFLHTWPFALGAGPLGQARVERSVVLQDGLPRVVGKRFGDEDRKSVV